MLFTVLSGLITSSLIVPFGRFLKTRWGFILAFLPVLLFLYFARYIVPIGQGSYFVQSTSWVPSLGINLDFKLDGLSLLFALLITGIGACIFFYANAYLKGHRYIDRLPLPFYVGYARACPIGQYAVTLHLLGINFN